MNRNIGGYVAGNLVISLICGAVTTLSLYVFRVPYSLALGVFMAVFDLIPLVGATIGSLVVIPAALLWRTPVPAIVMFVIVNVYQQIENHILQPMIYGNTVKIPSLTVLVAVLCGGAALGLVGRCLPSPSPARSRPWSASCWRSGPRGSALPRPIRPNCRQIGPNYHAGMPFLATTMFGLGEPWPSVIRVAVALLVAAVVLRWSHVLVRWVVAEAIAATLMPVQTPPS